jgi:formylglycine-generating enzyme required for sulfatase activity
MTHTENPNCLINQSTCGRIPGEPICPKCGLDERVRYVNEEARQLAVKTAEAQYWQMHARVMEERFNQQPVPQPKPRPISTPVQCRAVGEIFQDLPIAPQMVVLPSGRFYMGSADNDAFGDESEFPQHKVTISHKLAMGRYPVTFEEWDACVADGGVDHKPRDEGWGRGRRPVIYVSWDDAQDYVAWLNTKLGLAANDATRYRLPSEAEWEYACRAGTKGNFSTPRGLLSDNDATYDASDVEAKLSPKAGKKPDKTTPVGFYAPNPWGLYDMYGNVCEWVQDDYEHSYQGAPTNGSAWATGAENRVLRGGSWLSGAVIARSAFRYNCSPVSRINDHGFRLARTVP